MHAKATSTVDRSASDDALMAGAASGDTAAQGELADRHYARVLNFAYRLCGNPEVARDVTQDCFLQLFRGAARYTPKSQFTGYLYTVVLNLAREYGRRDRRRLRLGLAAFATSVIPWFTHRDIAKGPSPDERREARELDAQLNKALQTLREETRTVFVLSELEGRPYSEIARILGCPEGTVASRKHEAVVELRKLLAEWR